MQITVPPPPLRGERPSALLCADKLAVVATDAIIPHRPPILGGESKLLVLISNSRKFKCIKDFYFCPGKGSDCGILYNLKPKDCTITHS